VLTSVITTTAEVAETRRLISMLHAGIDMHKEFLMVTVLDQEGSEVVSPGRIPTGGPSIEEFFVQFEPEEIAAVLEAGPNWYWLCDRLDGLGIENRLCHPLKTRAIASARIKTDTCESQSKEKTSP
jgi:transposase